MYEVFFPPKHLYIVDNPFPSLNSSRTDKRQIHMKTNIFLHRLGICFDFLIVDREYGGTQERRAGGMTQRCGTPLTPERLLLPCISAPLAKRAHPFLGSLPSEMQSAGTARRCRGGGGSVERAGSPWRNSSTSPPPADIQQGRRFVTELETVSSSPQGHNDLLMCKR